MDNLIPQKSGLLIRTFIQKRKSATKQQSPVYRAIPIDPPPDDRTDLEHEVEENYRVIITKR